MITFQIKLAVREKRKFFLMVVTIFFLNGCARSPEEAAARFLASGKTYASKNDHASAILQFKNAVRAQSSNAEAYFQLGLSYAATGSAREAVQSLIRSTQLRSGYLPAQLKIAELMVGTGDEVWLKEGRERAARIVAEHPGHPDALFILAAADAHSGELRLSEERLRSILSSHPDHVQSVIALAAIQYAQNHVQAAEESLQTAVGRNSGDSRLRIALGELYLATGRLPAAEAQFRTVLQRDAKDIRALLELAAVQIAAGRMPDAEQTYRRISVTSPRDYGQAYPAFLIREGKLQPAIAELKRLSDEHPGNWTIRTSLVGAYIAANRLPEAKAVLRAALDESSRDVPALLQRAQLYVQSGNYHEAEQDIARVLRYQYNSAEAHHVLAKIHNLRGDILQQRQQLDEALRFQPEYLQARIELARLLIKTHNAKTAVALMNQSPAAQKRSLPVIIQRNWALLASGDKASFKQGIADGLAQGDFAELHVQDGLLHLMEGRRAEARKSLERALDRNPAETRALHALAQTYEQEKQPRKAEEIVRGYAARAPASPDVQMLLGTWLMKFGRQDEARQAFANAKALDRRYYAADLALADLDASVKRYTGARQQLTGVLADNPELAPARLMLAMIEEAAGEDSAAIRNYRKVVEAEPDNVVALNNLAYLLSNHSEDLDIALKFAQRAKELARNDGITDDTLGWVLCRKQLYRQAVPYLEHAVAKRPNAKVRYHLAIAYARSGDAGRAKATLSSALAVDPTLEEAKLAREALEEGRPGSN